MKKDTRKLINKNNEEIRILTVQHVKAGESQETVIVRWITAL